MKSGDFTSRPEDPINPGDKAGATFSGIFLQGRGLRNDQWPRIQLQRDAEEEWVTENPRVVAEDTDPIGEGRAIQGKDRISV